MAALRRFETSPQMSPMRQIADIPDDLANGGNALEQDTRERRAVVNFTWGLNNIPKGGYVDPASAQARLPAPRRPASHRERGFQRAAKQGSNRGCRPAAMDRELTVFLHRPRRALVQSIRREKI
jgi:hypothetical protein